MIGKVEFARDSQLHTLILEDDGTVFCAHPFMKRELEYRLGQAGNSPSLGRPGVKVLTEFARDVGGKLVLEEKEPGKPGTIY